jgi:ribonuclease J
VAPAPGKCHRRGVVMEALPGTVRLVPLGGLGLIGMNCLAVEQADGIVIVDCGIAFPDGNLGIDVLHPDFTWLVERADRVRGVFLTHGHEDHVGGLPYLLDQLDVPVWGPPHALAMARRRLLEHEFSPGELDLRPVRAGEVVGVGSFEIEPVRVTHSIVEASALRIATAGGTLLHTGDFNLDDDPPDGEPTDEARLARIGDEGVALMLSDSTNSDVPERIGSERSVANAVETLVAAAPSLVVIAMFASNVQRLITFGDMAERLGRKVLVLGRSLESQVSIASELRRLAWPSDLMVSADAAKSLPRERLLVLAGGTQAEPGSALRRLSLGQHPALRLEAGDSVLLSSRVIPGNERGVFEMQNDLLRLGVTLHTRVTAPGIHTSGHAARKEQRRMLELVRPRCFLP